MNKISMIRLEGRSRKPMRHDPHCVESFTLYMEQPDGMEMMTGDVFTIFSDDAPAHDDPVSVMIPMNLVVTVAWDFWPERDVVDRTANIEFSIEHPDTVKEIEQELRHAGWHDHHDPKKKER